jgi:hypothetical protein
MGVFRRRRFTERRRIAFSASRKPLRDFRNFLTFRLLQTLATDAANPRFDVFDASDLRRRSRKERFQIFDLEIVNASALRTVKVVVSLGVCVESSQNVRAIHHRDQTALRKIAQNSKNAFSRNFGEFELDVFPNAVDDRVFRVPAKVTPNGEPRRSELPADASAKFRKLLY